MRGIVFKIRILSEYKQFDNKRKKFKCKCGKDADYVIDQKCLYSGTNIGKYEEQFFLCNDCLADILEEMAKSVRDEEKDDTIQQ